jgi:hypothetical protein
MARQSNPFPSRGLLAESGEVRAGGSLAHGLIISRALCRFKRFVAPAGLTGSKRDRAALLHAEAHAPFRNSAWLALRIADGAEIWYWDRDRVPKGAIRPTPESVCRSPAEGWRIVTCIDGFEAQCFSEGQLLATFWRREPFEQAHWASFVASVDVLAPAAPDTPPQAQQMPLADAHWRRRIIRAPLSWKEFEQAAFSVAACGVALTLFFSGQALRHEARADASERALVESDALFDSSADMRRARERQNLLTAASRVIGEQTAATALADVLSAFDALAIEPRAVMLGADSFSAVIDQPERPVREVIARLEETGWLCAVTPEIIGRGGGVEVRAVVRQSREARCAGLEASP